MSFDGSPEEMYPEHFPAEDVPINDPDRQPSKGRWSIGWTFRVDHQTYGFFFTEEKAWEEFERVTEEAYPD